MVLIVDVNKIQVFHKDKPVTPSFEQSDFVVLHMASASVILLSSTGENLWFVPFIEHRVERNSEMSLTYSGSFNY